MCKVVYISKGRRNEPVQHYKPSLFCNSRDHPTNKQQLENWTNIYQEEVKNWAGRQLSASIQNTALSFWLNSGSWHLAQATNAVHYIMSTSLSMGWLHLTISHSSACTGRVFEMCVLIKILSHAGAKKKTKRIKGFRLALLLVIFSSHHGSEGGWKT